MDWRYFWPSEGPTWSDYLTALGYVGVIAGAFWALQELERRRRERIEQRQCELAEEVLSLFYEAESVFDKIRNPLVYVGEGSTRQRDETSKLSPNVEAELDREFVAIKRLDKHSEFFAKAASLLPRIRALFGEECDTGFRTIFVVRNEIVWAAESGMGNVIDKFATPEDRKEWRAIKSARDGDKDPIAKKLKEAKAILESRLLPLLRSRFT